MAKPRQTTNNRPKVSEGQGDGTGEEGGEGEVVGNGGEGEAGKQGKSADYPPRRGANRYRKGHEAREGDEKTAEKEEEK